MAQVESEVPFSPTTWPRMLSPKALVLWPPGRVGSAVRRTLFQRAARHGRVSAVLAKVLIHISWIGSVGSNRRLAKRVRAARNVRATAWPVQRAEVDQGAEAIPNEGVPGGPLAPSLNFTATALLSNGLWNSGLRRPRLHLLPGQRHVFARHDFFHPVSPKMIRRTSPQAGRLHLIDEGSVSVGFKIRTADGTLINHIEGCKTGTKEAVSQSFERDRAGSFCVLTRSPGDRQGRVFREFARRLAWNGSERNSSSGSQQIALAGGWLCSLESYRRSGALSVDAGAAEKLSP